MNLVWLCDCLIICALPVLTVYVMYVIVTYTKRVHLVRIIDAISVQYLESIYYNR